MSCPDLAIEGIDGILYARLVQQALRAGASFDGNRWTLSDVEFSVRHDLPSSTLHLICTKKPFFVTCGMVAEKIQELISQAKEAA